LSWHAWAQDVMSPSGFPDSSLQPTNSRKQPIRQSTLYSMPSLEPWEQLILTTLLPTNSVYSTVRLLNNESLQHSARSSNTTRKTARIYCIHYVHIWKQIVLERRQRSS